MRYARVKRGLPAMRARRQWTDEQIAMLGTVSDAVVAERLGCSNTTVYKKRTELGIAPVRHRWTAEEIALLGRISDFEVAKRVGLSAKTVNLKRRALGIAALRSGGGQRGRLAQPARDESLCA